MPLARESAKSSTKKPERIPHKVTPIRGEYGRYAVSSATAAKEGKEEDYIVDIFEEEETNVGKVLGTCPCRGWSVRKDCTHLLDARAEHARLEAEGLGFKKIID